MLKSSKAFEFIFLAWLLTMPFGSKIGAVSFGLFTVYPNLIFSALLLGLLFFTFKNWTKTFKVVALFLAGWLIFAVAYGAQLGIGKEVVFDIRSLTMQLIYALILFSTYTFLGSEKFIRILILGLRCFLIVLLLFGLFEFYTGNHLDGTTTEKFAHMAVGMVFYAPTFIYDNPNDYMLYGMFILMVLSMFDMEIRKRPFSIITAALILTLYNICSTSRLAFIGLTIIILIQTFIVLLQNRQHFNIVKVIPIGISLALAGLLFVFNPIFLGPKYNTENNPYQYNDLRILNMSGDTIKEIRAFQYLSEKEKAKVREFKETSSVHYVKGEDVVKIVSQNEVFSEDDRIRIEEGIPADQVRVNLIKNGFSFVKQNPFLGIGPGQFRKLHAEKKVDNPTGTVNSPHNFVMELISQYGLFGWGYLGFILFFFIQLIRKWQKEDWIKNLNLALVFVLLPLFWLMPSSYLYMDINWLLVPFLAVVFTNLQLAKDGK